MQPSDEHPTGRGVAAILANAEAKRGLWIGLHHDEQTSPRSEWIHAGVQDPHVTLAHFGKSCRNAAYVLTVIGVAAELAHSKAFDAYVSGEARWIDRSRERSEGDPIVLLLEGAALHALRAEFVAKMIGVVSSTAIDIPRFVYGPGWTPHVTLRRTREGDDVALAHRVSRGVRFNAISVVCGDARIMLPMATPT